MTGLLPANLVRKDEVKGSYIKMVKFLTGKPRPLGQEASIGNFNCTRCPAFSGISASLQLAFVASLGLDTFRNEYNRLYSGAQ